MSVLWWVLWGCGGAPEPVDTGGLVDDPPAECDAPSLGTSRLRKLSNDEVDHTLRDLVGVEGLASGLPEENRIDGFATTEQWAAVSALAADGLLRASEAASVAVVAELDCVEGRACAEALVSDVGPRAWRRPLDTEEVAIVLGVYDALEGAPEAERLQAMVQVLIQSPQFVYRIEVGTGDEGTRQLTEYELASRLSYTLWGTMPDPELFAKAASGALVGDLEATVDRMLADPKARAQVGALHLDWTGVHDLGEHDKTIDGWSPELAALLRTETASFVESVVFDEDGSLQTLLTADWTIANGQVASHYGLEGGVAWDRLETPGRAGLLTQPGLMSTLSHSNQTSIVHRGLFVRERLLCQTLPDPPDDLDISLPPLDPGLSSRERFARHQIDPACASCHELIDPIGLGFEHYDPLGRWRETANGADIDASGLVVGADGIGGRFVGVPELAARLAAAPAVQTCYADTLFRYAHGRDPVDACETDGMQAAFADSDGHIPTLLRALVTDPGFRTLRVEE